MPPYSTQDLQSRLTSPLSLLLDSSFFINISLSFVAFHSPIFPSLFPHVLPLLSTRLRVSFTHRPHLSFFLLPSPPNPSLVRFLTFHSFLYFTRSSSFLLLPFAGRSVSFPTFSLLLPYSVSLPFDLLGLRFRFSFCLLFPPLPPALDRSRQLRGLYPSPPRHLTYHTHPFFFPLVLRAVWKERTKKGKERTERGKRRDGPPPLVQSSRRARKALRHETAGRLYRRKET